MRMKAGGFTLIELIIAMVIIGISTSGLVVVMQQVMVDRHKPEIMLTATSLAADQAERVIRLSFDNVADENRGSPVSFGGDFAAYNWEVRVDSTNTTYPGLGADPMMQDHKVVEVRVHHNTINYISITFLKTNN